MNHVGDAAAIGLLTAVTDLVVLADGESQPGRVLGRLCHLSREVVAADAATVMLKDASGLRFAHASPAPFAQMGRLQEQLQIGPCRDSIDQRQVVVTATHEELERWPAMASAASDLGISTVLSVPLISRGQARGVLDLYGRSPIRWTAEQILTATLLGRIVANFMASAADEEAAWSVRTVLEHRATHDALTDLPNRALFFDRLEHALLGANRSQHSIAVLFIDLDHFKSINDRFGHAAGDATLVEISQRLSGILRDSDTLARLAGDEFVVICEDIQGSQDTITHQLSELGRRIHAELNRPLALDGSIQMTVSIGISIVLVVGNDHSKRTLLATADDAMYESKRAGQGQTTIRCE